MMPLLSICIPTYNRAFYLCRLLDSIIKQKEFAQGNVEIIISDNCSTDNTCFHIKKYLDLYGDYIFYQYNSTPICPEENFRNVAKLAKGEYIKFVNDSAIFKDNSIEFIFSVLKHNLDAKTHLFFANANINVTRIYSFNEFIVKEGYLVTDIRKLSFWNKDKEFIVNDNTYDKLLLWSCGSNLKLASHHNNILWVGNEIIVSQDLKTKVFNYNLYTVFHDNFLTIINNYFISKKISIEDYYIIEKKLYLDFFVSWIINYENNDGRFLYNVENNIKKKVFNDCKQKKYYIEFLLKYYKQWLFIKIKNMINNLCNK